MSGERDASFSLRSIDRTLHPALKHPERLRVNGPITKPHEPDLDLSDYLTADPDNIAETLPPAVHRDLPGYPWGMLMNDTLGDCGEAMACHGIEAMRAIEGEAHVQFVDEDAERLYEHVGGYVPGDPDTDQGTDNKVLSQYWKNPGIYCQANKTRHKAPVSVYVDPSQLALTQLAIYEFMVCFRAVGLPMTAQKQTASGEWELVDPKLKGDSAVGSWGYHDIPLRSYDQNGLLVVTWGSELVEDNDFDHAYAVQGFFVLTHDQLGQKSRTINGVDWSKLLADAAKVPSVPAS
jgi:hypothetical protein